MSPLLAWKRFIPVRLKRWIKYLYVFGIPKTIAIHWKLSMKSHDLIELPLPDSNVSVFLRTSTSDIGAFHEVYLDQDYNFPVDFNPGIIVDAGANVGYTSVYFACRFPDARIIAIEPEESNLQVLRKNASKFPKIVVMQAGVWHKSGLLKIHNPGAKNYSFRLSESNSAKNSVQGLTIEDILQTEKVEFIDILKLDIEGSEKEVLENSLNWINKIRVLIVELHDRYNPGCSAALQQIVSGSDFVEIGRKSANLVALRNRDSAMN